VFPQIAHQAVPWTFPIDQKNGQGGDGQSPLIAFPFNQGV